ncbi:unnamed protein product, partial [Porites evermanni]
KKTAFLPVDCLKSRWVRSYFGLKRLLDITLGKVRRSFSGLINYQELPRFLRFGGMDKMQWARGLFPFLTTFVLMTSASVLSSDHTNSKSRGLLDAAVNSNEVSQNTAAVPSSSSLSMSSSKDFHSITLAIRSSPFEVLSAGMANKQTITPLTLVSSVLVTSSVLVSTSVVLSSALSRSYPSSVATMS